MEGLDANGLESHVLQKLAYIEAEVKECSTLRAELVTIKELLKELNENNSVMTVCRCLKTVPVLGDESAEAGDKVKTINKENQNTDKKVDGHHQKIEVAQDFKEEERTELVNPTDTVDAVQSYAEDQEKIEVYPSQTKRRRKRRLTNDIEAECLGKVLQENIVLLVENMQFSSSGLCDLLVGNDCLTGDECAALTSLNPKDQIRNTIRLIKGRSFDVLKKFLNCVQRFHPDIAETVWKTYEEKKKHHTAEKICTFCKLKRAIDVRYIADFVWSVDGISDDVYADIVSHTRCNTSDNIKWERLADASNQSDIKKILKTIIYALQRKGYYSHLIPSLKRETKLVCRCAETIEIRIDFCTPIEITDDDRTTLSPISSNEPLISMLDLKDIGSLESNLDMNEESRITAFRLQVSQTLSPVQSCLSLTDLRCDSTPTSPRTLSHNFVKSIGYQRRASCFS